jgi:tRNA (guanine-N7-)-methyltransferase
VSVRRERRLPLEELAPYLLAPRPSIEDRGSKIEDREGRRGDTPSSILDPRSSILDFQAVFGNDNPVEIEVGFGKGLFLVRAAQESPGVNFLGIEVVRKYQLFTATRLAKRRLTNVRLALADARVLLRECVATASVQAVHVYYPDPWWKKRHQKRRVFTAGFAAQCERVLRPGGRLYVVTDVPEYFQVITELVAQNTRLRPLALPELRAPAGDLDYLTNFERKFRKQGKPIHRAFYERTGSPPAGTLPPPTERAGRA